MQVTDIRNTGPDGLDERTFRLGLRLNLVASALRGT